MSQLYSNEENSFHASSAANGQTLNPKIVGKIRTTPSLRKLSSELYVHFDGAEAELAGVDGRLEGGHYDRIKLRAGQRPNAVHSVI